MGLRLHGDWIREKWRVRSRRGFLKVHVAVDLESKQVLSIRVTNERVSDGSQLIPLVSDVMVKGRVIHVYADGAYDSRRSFTFLYKHDIDLVIRVTRILLLFPRVVRRSWGILRVGRGGRDTVGCGLLSMFSLRLSVCLASMFPLGSL